MSYSGSIIEHDGKYLYVFGSTEVVSWSEEYPDKYHIGVNLDTGKIDDVKASGVHEVRFNQLSDEQQSILGVHIPVYHKLKRIVLAISAKARSGKDTLSDYVRGQFNQTFIAQKALAEPIYEIRRLLYGEPKLKDRAPLIMIGQGLRREDPNIWIKVWLARAIEALQNCGSVSMKFIVSDVRQPNEFKFFRSLGALTVKIVADEEKRLNKIRELDGVDAVDEKLLKDSTETHANGFDTDITVHNNYDNNFLVDVDAEVVTELAKRGW